jgi:hypothetical protein
MKRAAEAALRIEKPRLGAIGRGLSFTQLGGVDSQTTPTALVKLTPGNEKPQPEGTGC